MVELRFVERDAPKKGCTLKVLQMRSLIQVGFDDVGRAYYTTEWSDWQDVPLATE